MHNLNAASAMYDWYSDKDGDTITFTIEDSVTISGSLEDVAALLEQMLEEVK